MVYRVTSHKWHADIYFEFSINPVTQKENQLIFFIFGAREIIKSIIVMMVITSRARELWCCHIGVHHEQSKGATVTTHP
jgi:hypothetical protein